NRFTVVSTLEGETIIDGADGADRFAVRSIEGDTTINAGAGDDLVYVGGIRAVDASAARLVVRGGPGNDQFAIDDTNAMTTLDGGEDNDTFQVGQLYGSARILTVETTHGRLTRGATTPTTIYGGTGNDRISVYSNTAALRVEGNAGDDEVTVRAFALPSGSDRYSIDTPVDVDGGTGLDKVVVIGTERDDNFVTTEQNVFGAGLSVRYDQAETLEVDGLEGDDDFFVQGT